MLTTQDGPPLLLVSPGQRGATGPGLPPRPVRLGARHGDQRADGLAGLSPAVVLMLDSHHQGSPAVRPSWAGYRPA